MGSKCTYKLNMSFGVWSHVPYGTIPFGYPVLFCIALSSVLFYMMNMIVLCYYCDKVKKKSKCAQKMIQDKMPEVNAICCLKWECVSHYPRLLL